MARGPLATPFVIPQTADRHDVLARYFRVLADPVRLRILESLEDSGALSVSELVARVGEPQPKVSNHLACLRWCGFVERERRHPRVYYRLADARIADVLALGRELMERNAHHVASCERLEAP